MNDDKVPQNSKVDITADHPYEDATDEDATDEEATDEEATDGWTHE